MMARAFLRHFVEGYLFGDLDTMTAASAQATADVGRLGYPIFMSCSAGIELLGMLVSAEPITRQSGGHDGPHAPRTNFARFWTNYLYPNDRARRDAANAVFQLIRNGVAHTFVAKDWDIKVDGEHLKRTGDTPRLNAVQLATDLKNAYAEFVHVLDGVTKKTDHDAASIELRVAEFLQLNARTAEAQQHRDAIGALPESPPTLAFGQGGTLGQTTFHPPEGAVSSGSYSYTLSLLPKTKP